MRDDDDKRIDCRINTELHDLSRERCNSVKVRKRRRRRRIGVVVSRHVNRLNRRDRTRLRRRDALLHFAHLRREVWLVTHRRRHTTEQCRHFRARLCEAEDVVDKEQHVETLIAEILSDCQTGKRDAQARSGRLSHLTVNQRHLRLSNRFHVDLRQIEHAGVVEMLVERRRQTG